MYMLAKLEKAGVRPIGVTKEPEDNSLKRGQGISDFLSENADITHYVIIDDYLFDMQDEMARHLVLIDEIKGLTESDAEVAIGVLKGDLLPRGQYDEVVKDRGYYR